MNVQTFVMMGRPGSGKGTQAKLLAELTGFELYSTGARTRAMAEVDSDVGRKVKKTAEQGLLQPHWLASYFFEELLLSRPIDHGIIFDGTCRKLPEAVLFNEVTTWLERPFRVVYLDVREEVVLERLEKRLTIEGRKDDVFQSIKKRLEEFRNETEPALAYMREQGNVIDIPGEGEPDAIFALIEAQLKDL